MTSMGEVFHNQTTDAAKEETQASRVQRLLSQQEEEIRQLKAQIAVMKHDLHWAVRGLEGSEIGRKHDLARIEALEAALRQVVGILDDPTGGQHVADMRSAASVARAALEGKR